MVAFTCVKLLQNVWLRTRLVVFSLRGMMFRKPHNFYRYHWKVDIKSCQWPSFETTECRLTFSKQSTKTLEIGLWAPPFFILLSNVAAYLWHNNFFLYTLTRWRWDIISFSLFLIESRLMWGSLLAFSSLDLRKRISWKVYVAILVSCRFNLTLFILRILRGR